MGSQAEQGHCVSTSAWRAARGGAENSLGCFECSVPLLGSACSRSDSPLGDSEVGLCPSKAEVLLQGPCSAMGTAVFPEGAGHLQGREPAHTGGCLGEPALPSRARLGTCFSEELPQAQSSALLAGHSVCSDQQHALAAGGSHASPLHSTSSHVFAQHHPCLHLHSLGAGPAICSPCQQLRCSAQGCSAGRLTVLDPCSS